MSTSCGWASKTPSTATRPDPNDPMKLRKMFNLPLSFTHNGFQHLAYPIWNGFQSGILATPELIVGGPTYAERCVRQAQREQKATGRRCHAGERHRYGGKRGDRLRGRESENKQGGKDACGHSRTPLPAHGEQTVTIEGAWDNPTLWWPGANAHSVPPAHHHQAERQGHRRLGDAVRVPGVGDKGQRLHAQRHRVSCVGRLAARQRPAGVPCQLPQNAPEDDALHGRVAGRRQLDGTGTAASPRFLRSERRRRAAVRAAGRRGHRVHGDRRPIPT